MRGSQIAAVGAYVPPTVLGNDEFERRFELAPGTIEAKTGLRGRRRSSETDHPTSMGLRAIERTLAAADIAANDVDMIISASSSKDQGIPTDAMIYANRLGIPGVQCLHMEAVCQSFLNALEVADLYISAGRHNVVLIVSAEQTSRVVDPDDYTTSILLGDGAAAALVTETGGPSRIEASYIVTEALGRNIDVATLRGGGLRYMFDDPEFTREMRFFRVDGPMELRLAARLLPGVLEQLLGSAGCSLDDIDWIVPHQVLPTMVKRLLARSGVPEDKVYINADYGNQAAASIPIGLAELTASGRLERGQRVLLIGGAAGFTIGGVIVTY
jgi:3-oxoacyl-[acyl-carrier-protein] synthase III